jgi:hypothetical protein
VLILMRDWCMVSQKKKDWCMVCIERTIGSEIVLDAPDVSRM